MHVHVHMVHMSSLYMCLAAYSDRAGHEVGESRRGRRAGSKRVEGGCKAERCRVGEGTLIGEQLEQGEKLNSLSGELRRLFRRLLSHKTLQYGMAHRCLVSFL